MIYEPTDFASPYNSTYPLTSRFIDEQGHIHMRVALVSDADERSKSLDGKSWVSTLQFAEFVLDPEWKSAKFILKESCEISNAYSYGGRGAELSELIVFNGNLYTIDDRTGIVYNLIAKCPGAMLIPWVILSDGPGNVNKGFKGEWLSVKDEVLYAGGMGKAYTHPSNGEILNLDPYYVKAISNTGQVQHLDWRQNYESLSRAVSVGPTGYLIHEAVAWSQHHKQWFFLPRKESNEMYNEVADELKGTNLVIRSSAGFNNVKYSRLRAQPIEDRGFSTFKFVPHTNDLILIGIKTREHKGSIASYVTVFKTNMEPLLDEVEISDSEKFEGLEFV